MAVVAMCVHWTVILSLYAANPCGTFWVFAVPAVAGSFALSEFSCQVLFLFAQKVEDLRCRCLVSLSAAVFGNWSQHIFVDPNKPRCVGCFLCTRMSCPRCSNRNRFIRHVHCSVAFPDADATIILPTTS